MKNKMKTKKSVSKRFKITAGGKLKKYNQNTSHLALSKTHKQKVNLRHARYLTGTNARNMKKLISF